MKPSKAAELQRLYARVPHIECKQLCAEACGPIGCSREERSILVRRVGRAPTADPQTLACNLLRDGLCTAYTVRPMICRLWGVVESMPCPHGCIPDRWLTHQEGHALLAEANAIGGDDTKRFLGQARRILPALKERLEAAP